MLYLGISVSDVYRHSVWITNIYEFIRQNQKGHHISTVLQPTLYNVRYISIVGGYLRHLNALYLSKHIVQ